MAKKSKALREKVQNAAARTFLSCAMLVPYAYRIRLAGWVVSRCVAPFTGWPERIRRNLALVAPELLPDQVEKIVRKVPNNVGRTLIEIYSGQEFLNRIKDAKHTGPGVSALKEAQEIGKPLVLLTAHIGNYDAVRGSMAQQGHPMAALYKPMKNAAFNAHYVKAISTIAEPVYPTDGRGVTSLMRHLKDGGTIGIVGDIALRSAPVLTFFGAPALTPVSAAEWALKYGATVIPVFGIRQTDGLSFEIYVDAPIPHSTPETMMQGYNDSVEAIVRQNIDQWFWIHRRWKSHKPDGFSAYG